MRNQTCFLKCWKRDSASAAALVDAMRSKSCLTGLKVCPNTPCNHNRNFKANWHAALAVINIGCQSPCTILLHGTPDRLHTLQRGVHTPQKEGYIHPEGSCIHPNKSKEMSREPCKGLLQPEDPKQQQRATHNARTTCRESQSMAGAVQNSSPSQAMHDIMQQMQETRTCQDRPYMRP